MTNNIQRQPLPVMSDYDKLQISVHRKRIAYKNDGTLVKHKLPRFEQGGSASIMVEEGTKNLLALTVVYLLTM